MAETFTYNLATTIGQLRLNIGDVDLGQTDGQRKNWTVIFTDEELQSFLTRAGSDISLASYLALMVVASVKSLLAKRQTLGDFSEDLTQLAVQVRAQAQGFLDQYNTMNSEPACGYAEQAVSDFNIVEIIANMAARGNIVP